MTKLIPKSRIYKKINSLKQGGNVSKYQEGNNILLWKPILIPLIKDLLNTYTWFNKPNESLNKESYNDDDLANQYLTTEDLIYLSSKQLQTAKDVYKYLLERNVNSRNAAAIMGNILQESAFDRNARQINGDHAEGLFQMHGQQLNEYKKWLKKQDKNKLGRYPEIDYVLYMINDEDHPYTNEYNRVLKLPKTPENIKYIEDTYGERIKNNTLYLIYDLHDAWNDNSTSLNDLTDLFVNTIERAGKPAYENRRKFANYFYNYFNDKSSLQ